MLLQAKSGRNKELQKDKLLLNQSKYLEKFEVSAQRGSWGEIHHDHYDWWMFPIDEKSSKGMAYTVYMDDILVLKNDLEYMANLKRGMELLLLAWGWDIKNRELVQNPGHGQEWQRYPVRFFKCLKSALLFGIEDYAASMKDFAILLEKRGELPDKNEDAFRVKKLFGFEGTLKRDMPPPRYQ
eukprot:TRINITY_DN2423_c0_g1_i1.p1 TRINITY_DN2423_c0_g1~~TRINITY_DN2423_c0_g1_i1.p1  ORF type:complete len:183 (+),score=37.42 TRINITY_DN2423_c0_g1_i1:467-1015(+)